MHQSLHLEHQTRPTGRGRLQLLLILLVVIGPILLATAMYQWRFWVPEGRTFHGQLQGGGQTLADLGVTGSAAAGWRLLVTDANGCAAECRELVYLARQIHIGLGREASRASHALALSGALDADYAAQLEREYPQLKRLPLEAARYAGFGQKAARLWIVDPLGNLVLGYPGGVSGKAVLEDLRHLLKLSRLG
ncbi:MAG TPA: hypothetical protein VL178_04130 [Pseudomonas sp.]|nr:hypothetical protein [Pseudomonas sp.]